MSDIKIGILACGYDCLDDLYERLLPWRHFTNMKGWEMACIVAMFEEYAEDGFKYDDSTFQELFKNNTIKWLTRAEEPLPECEARNWALKPLLASKVDYIWLLDLQDEYYTIDEIYNIFKFIQINPYVDWFGINFKNFVGDRKHYVNGFCPPRIFCNKRHGGIKCFYFDNDIIYNNGQNYKHLSSINIPSSVAHIRHYSWCGNEERLKAKIAYQQRHFGHCGYKWNHIKDEIEFDSSYHLKYNIPIPELLTDE